MIGLSYMRDEEKVYCISHGFLTALLAVTILLQQSFQFYLILCSV